MVAEFFSTVLYVVGFLFLFIWLVWKKKSLLSKYIVLIWLVSSIFALLYQINVPFFYSKLEILPYIYLFFCFFIMVWPLFDLRIDKRELQGLNLKYYRYVMFVFVVVSIIPFIENLLYVLQTFNNDSSSLADMYDNKMEESGNGVNLSSWLSPLGRLGNSIDGVFFDFLFFSFFYLLTQNISKINIILFFLPVANHLLFQLAMAGRTTVAIFVLISFFFIIIFYNKIYRRQLRFVKRIGMIILSLSILGLSVISFSRKEAHNSNDDNLVFFGAYLGKGHLDFNKQMWHIKKNTEGDNCFSFVKKCIGLNTFTDYKERRQYWSESKIGVPPYIFYTFVGDLFMDFHIFAFIFILLLSLFFYKAAKANKQCSILFVFFVYVYAKILIQGWAYLGFKTYGATVNLLLSFILLFVLTKFNQNKVIFNIRYGK